MKKIQLLKEHRHNGIDLPVGAVIEVPADIAEFLVKVGSAKVLGDAKPEAK